MMKIRRVSWTPYKIPFKSDFRTSHGAIPVREGAILRLETDDGRIGLGDIAPLESYNGESLTNALLFVADAAPLLIGSDVDLVFVGGFFELLKAVQYGINLALCDVLAQKSGQSIAAFLSQNDFVSFIEVNATIGATRIEDAVREAWDVAAAGYRVAKLKVGVMESDEVEIERIIAVQEALGADPHIQLRLDANGAWTARQAIKILNALETFQCINLVEQPTPKNEIDALAEVQQRVTINVAVDEAVTDAEAARRIIVHKRADVLVVKPMILGGLQQAHAIIKMAEEAGIGVIVTSMLESGIGVVGALHLAATLKQPALACGLATTQLLEADLLKTPLEVRDGYMSVPQGAGLGVELDEDQLRRYGGQAVVVE